MQTDCNRHKPKYKVLMLISLPKYILKNKQKLTYLLNI